MTRKGARQTIREHNAKYGREKNSPEDLTASYSPQATSQTQAISELVQRMLMQAKLVGQPAGDDDSIVDDEEEELSVYQIADMAADLEEETEDDQALEGGPEKAAPEDPPPED